MATHTRRLSFKATQLAADNLLLQKGLEAKAKYWKTTAGRVIFIAGFRTKECLPFPGSTGRQGDAAHINKAQP